MKTENWTIDKIHDLKGKVVIVTGANSGTGFEITRVLAGKNATLIMACRSEDRAIEARNKIMAEFPTALIQVKKLNLASLHSITQFVTEFESEFKELHLLINNAGIMAPPFSLTEDGFESQIGTNHLGHFALTGQLMDMLLKTKGSRIVTMSSIAHRSGNMDFNDLHRKSKYKPFEAYSQSKLANLLFTYELQRKLNESGYGTIAVAAHPGWTSTNLQKDSRFFEVLNPLFGMKPSQGALPLLYAAVAEDVKGGEYYGPGGLSEIWGKPKKVTSNRKSHDLNKAKHLWDVSEDLTKTTFAFHEAASVV